MEKVKKCTKCNEVKKYSEFNRRGVAKVQCVCKECRYKYRLANKQKKAAYDKQYRLNNIDKLREKASRDNEKYKDYNRLYKRNYHKRKLSDPLYKLKCYMRLFTWKAINRRSYRKVLRTETLLGCSIEDFKMHIESLFKPGMSWENRDEWHIDHIIPLASAKTEEEVIKLCHYTNLQPLWAHENLSKGAKYDKHT